MAMSSLAPSLQVYCCVGVLALTGQLYRVDADQLGWWLCERQLPSGGLNGMVRCGRVCVSVEEDQCFLCGMKCWVTEE